MRHFVVPRLASVVRPSRWLPALLPLAVCLAPAHARAQCHTQWQPGSIPGASSWARAAIWWDRDGGGPLAPVPVIGGIFTGAGSSVANRVAWYDASQNQWQPLGTGLDGDVLSLLAMPNGDLIAGGAFTTAGGVPAQSIARWDGGAWSALGSGMDERVYGLALLPNGDIVAGGSFTTADSMAASNLARWNGSAWSPLGSGVNASVTFPPVSSLLVMPNGDLIAGGSFTQIGGVAASCIARWDGSAWFPLGSGVIPGFPLVMDGVSSLTLLPGGDLVAGGRFDTAGGISAKNVARWNGSVWSALSGGISGEVRALATTPTGDLLAGGSPSSVMLWNGTSWTSIGGPGLLYALASDGNGSTLAGGGFTQPGANVALWNGSAWSALGTSSMNGGGFDGNVLAVAERANGDVLVGGAFSMAGGQPIRSLALWNGSSWTPTGVNLTALFPSPIAQVNAIATLSDGDVAIGGFFGSASGVAGTFGLARWNGSTTSSFGGGVSAGSNTPSISDIVPLPGGSLIAAGYFTSAGGVPAKSIARWNGATWSAFGVGLAGSVNAAIVLPNGDVVAGGTLTPGEGTPAGNIARWNGTSWTALGSGISGVVNALTALPGGDVIAGGQFETAGGVAARNIARWNGTSWSALGAGLGELGYEVRTLRTLPNGDVLAGGSFAVSGAVVTQRIARWDGSTWSPVDGGLGATGSAEALAMRANGDVLAVGDFQTAGSFASSRIAILRSSCLASASAVGAGCTGSGGLNRLAPSGRPWTGSTFVATATGMPVPGVAVFLYGAVPVSLPLSALLPWGVVGCDLSVTPIITLALPVMAGAASSTLALPNDPTLAGVSLLEQVLAVGTDPGGNIAQVTSTNALQITIGSF